MRYGRNGFHQSRNLLCWQIDIMGKMQIFDRLPKLLSVCGVQLSEVFNLALPYQTPLYFLHVPTMQNEINYQIS